MYFILSQGWKLGHGPVWKPTYDCLLRGNNCFGNLSSKGRAQCLAHSRQSITVQNKCIGEGSNVWVEW